MPKQANKNNTEPETGLSDEQLDVAAGGVKTGIIHACDAKYESMSTRELDGLASSGQGDLNTAGGTDVAIETIELAHEGFERE